MRFVILAVVSVAFLTPLSSPTLAARHQPRVEPVSVPGYALAVEGAGWAPGAWVTFTLALG